FLPWRMIAERKKAKFDIVNISEDWKLNEEDFDAKISGAKLLTITHASNVTGTILPIKEIIRKARKEGAIVVVDGAQAAPHLPVNVRDLDADFYAFSAHKMLGPTGLGVLYGKKALLEELPPFLLGGEMIKEVHTDGQTWNDVPWKFEAGTPNYADAIAFTEAIRYLKSIGMDNIHSYEKELIKYLLDQVKAVKDVKVYGPPVEERGAIMPFTVEGIHPHDIAGYLDSMAVAVRSGFHCAQPLQESMGLLDGTARASLYFYNDFEEIDKFVDAIRELVKVFL
ncbi:MAG: aminotransferase class V-fold PLP-dependent enzyme, partial [Nitrososphaerota archaeon]|nr:aminotransferase class V-fold PLP-dependent enzyme [Nitrososphaerota archaeon]